MEIEEFVARGVAAQEAADAVIAQSVAQQVWLVYDYGDVVAVATTEARAHRAAEEHTAADIDKKYFGPEAQKRFAWNDKGELSIYCPWKHHFSGEVHEWRGTGVSVSSKPLLTEGSDG